MELLLLGVVIGGPIWAIGFLLVSVISDWLDDLARWYRQSDGRAERRKRKRAKLEKKLAALEGDYR